MEYTTEDLNRTKETLTDWITDCCHTCRMSSLNCNKFCEKPKAVNIAISVLEKEINGSKM